MKRKTRTAIRCLGFGLALLAAGCQEADADKLTRAGQVVKAKLAAAASRYQSQLLRHLPRLADEETTLAPRVRARLRWDKTLAGQQIDVHAHGGHVTLQGSVATDNQRQRAVDLAQSTEGVVAVTDQLKLE
ncbi:MAG: BON domain-containing protein [Gemmataceae bacterium]